MQKQGKPWKVVGTYDSFEEADKKRKILIEKLVETWRPGEEEYLQTKIKRTGISGKQFTVKVRHNYPDLPAGKKKSRGKKALRAKSDK